METNQQNQDEIEIDLLELLRVLWSKIGYVILAALALGLLMVLVSKVFMKPQYESTTKMYVLSKQGQQQYCNKWRSAGKFSFNLKTMRS